MNAAPKLLCVAMLAFAAAAQAADYFVSPAGDDANPGTKDKPFKSPAFASEKLMPGDTLYFRAGEYVCKENAVVGLSPKRDGEPGKPITFAAYPGEKATIRAPSDWGVTPNGYDWIVFDGLEILGTVHYGMKISKGHGGRNGGMPSHITLRNLDVHGQPGEGVFAYGCEHLTVEHCHLHHSQRSHGLYLQVGCHYAVIRNNLSEDNYGNSGTQLNAAGGGIEHALVEGNVLRNNAQGWSLMGVRESVFRGNILYNNGYAGPRGSGNREVILWTYAEGDKPGTPCQNNLFENNTFVNLRNMHIFHIKSGTKGTVLRNNILWTGKNVCLTVDPDSTGGLVLENNCLFNAGGAMVAFGGKKLSLADFAKLAEVKIAGNVLADPLLADAQKFDLRLTARSPCIDAGLRSDSRRPFAGKAPDIGALELGASPWPVGPQPAGPKQ